MSRIGVIGTGHIAMPIVRHLVAKGHEITVTERSARASAALANECGVAIADPQGVLDRSDIVLLSLRPQHARTVLSPLTFRPDHQIVSVMAGVTRARLETLCAPANDFVQTIPLGFVQHGGCPLAAFGNAALLADLFAPENPVVEVMSEAALNSHFAVCAMVPGLLDLMTTGANWLGERTGDPAAAEFYVTHLVSGFLASLEDGVADQLAHERDALATDGTLSLQMVETLRTGGARDALQDALHAIEQRLNG